MSDPVTSIESTIYAKAKEAVEAEVAKLEPAAKAAVEAVIARVVSALHGKQKSAEAEAARLKAEAEAKLAAGETKLNG